MEITICHHKVFVESASDFELDKLKKACKIHFYKDPRKRQGYLRSVNLYNSTEKSFPTTYLDIVCEKLDKHNIDLEYEDNRIYPKRTIRLKNIKHEHPPRAWQKEAVDAAKTEPVGVIIAPTGDGKSRVIDELIIQKKVKTLIVVPQISNLDDTYKRIRTHWGTSVSKNLKKKLKAGDLVRDVKHGRVVQGREGFDDEIKESDSAEIAYLKTAGYVIHKGVPRKVRSAEKEDKKHLRTKYPDIVVTCRAGLDGFPLDYLEQVEMVIYEEGHTVGNETGRTPSLLMKNAAYRYTITATFVGESKEQLLELVATTGNNIIYEETYTEAVEQGNIKSIYYKQLETEKPILNGRPFKSSKVTVLDEIIKKCFIANESRNSQIIDLAADLNAEGRNVLIFVTEEGHGHILKARLKEIGLESYFYFREQKEELKEKYQKLAYGEEDSKPFIMIGTSAIGLGNDTKAINAIILADVRKSLKIILQRIGRGLRTYGKFEDLLVYDFQDPFNKTTKRWAMQREKTVNDYYFKEQSFTKSHFKDRKVKLNHHNK